MNSVNIAGNLTRDLELKTTTTGKSVLNTNVAVRRTDDHTDYIDVEIWGKTAEIVNKYCRKGDFVAIKGTLKVDSYTDNEGKNRKKVVVVADTCDFVTRNKTATPSEEPSGVVDDELSDILATDDELPF